MNEDYYDGPVPDPFGEPPVDEGTSKRLNAAHVVRFVEERYIIGATPAGEAFAVPIEGPQLPIMLESKGGRLTETVAAALYEQHSTVVGSKTVEDAMRIIIARSRQLVERQSLDLRVAESGDGLVIDLGQPGSAACAVITSSGWRVQDNPPEGVLFRRTAATRPLPTPDQHGSLEPLRTLIDIDSADHRWHLIHGWLIASCFPNIPRPMLLALGAPGSAKTTRARFVVSVLDPRQELGSNFGKNISDDQTKALGRFFVSYDNITGASETISDHLCRLVTGDEIDKRVLYSDNDLSTVSYRRTGAMTAVNMPALRADALERVVVVAVDRITDGARQGENDLRKAFQKQHGVILGGLCDDLSHTLSRLSAARAWRGPRPRMADYYDVLHAFDRSVAETYRAAAEGVMVEAAESDPFVAAVVEWLEEQQLPWRGESTEAWKAASRHRESLNGMGSDTWWPKNASRFTDALTTATEPLRAVGYEARRLRIKGRRLVEFVALQERDGGASKGDEGDEGAGILHPISHPNPPPKPQVSELNTSEGDEGDATRGSSPTPNPTEKKKKDDTVKEPAESVTPVTPALNPGVWDDGTPIPDAPVEYDEYEEVA